MKLALVAIVVLLASCATPQERMKYCNEQAGSMKGAERRIFMSKCLKA